MGAAPNTYADVEKQAWAFVDTLAIPGIARRGQVTKVITDAVMTAMMAGDVETRAGAVGGGRPTYAPPPPAKTPLEVMQEDLQRYLQEDLPRQLHQIVGTHVRSGLSQALEACARSARVDVSPVEEANETNRVHMATSSSIDSAAARMARLRDSNAVDAPLLGDANLCGKSVARSLPING